MFAVRLANPKSITIAARTKDNTTIYAIAIGYGGPDIGDELSIKCVVPKAGSVRLRTHALAEGTGALRGQTFVFAAGHSHARPRRAGT